MDALSEVILIVEQERLTSVELKLSLSLVIDANCVHKENEN